jgi:hypothetical protein
MSRKNKINEVFFKNKQQKSRKQIWEKWHRYYYSKIFISHKQSEITTIVSEQINK